MTKHRAWRSCKKKHRLAHIPRHVRILIEVLVTILVLRCAHIQVSDVLNLFKLFQ